jgi:hypothetical protein
VPVDGEALNARPLGDRADGRAHRAQLTMQVDRRVDDALPRLGLAERPLLELVSPRHQLGERSCSLI